MADVRFHDRYHDARTAFLSGLDELEGALGRPLIRHQQAVGDDPSVTIDAAELAPGPGGRLYVCVTGVHGIEGYAGSAVMRALMAQELTHLAKDAGLFLVHGLNAYGFHRYLRVNANNVDLNRNFPQADGLPAGDDTDAYGALRPILEPQGCYGGRRRDPSWLVARLLWAAARRGMGPLRKTILEGQYVSNTGLFYGGRGAEPETLFFCEHFERLSRGCSEVLLTDLHTGYGLRGAISPLFARADSPEFQRFAGQGVRDERGTDMDYKALGDLVGWSRSAAQRGQSCVFNGLVLELGTVGLDLRAQLRSLGAMVRENQVRRYGASNTAVLLGVQREFAEIFMPSSPQWRQQVQADCVQQLSQFLRQRSLLA